MRALAYPKHSAPPTDLLAARARSMRFEPTFSEQKLWSALRGQKLGTAFRRQVPIGSFVVDFLAPAVRLVVEVDGGYHARRLRSDARRDEKLRRLGYRVLRLEAELVMCDLGAALRRIAEQVEALRQAR